jgi:hypothetical protein
VVVVKPRLPYGEVVDEGKSGIFSTVNNMSLRSSSRARWWSCGEMGTAVVGDGCRTEPAWPLRELSGGGGEVDDAFDVLLLLL